MLHPSIFDIAEVCYLHGIQHVILCPGSRCAPLTLSFARHPHIHVRTISDERSAGFIALGIAQQTKTPVVLVCTSGTAAMNFAPAVAEAYFSEVPLVVFTADRPQEWIAQQDGQTIFQQNLYNAHTKSFVQLPLATGHADDSWFINRSLNQGILLCKAFPQGPVHFNVPFREPFYPTPEQQLSYSNNIRIIKQSEVLQSLTSSALEELRQDWQGKRILLVAGRMEQEDELTRVVTNFINKHRIPLVADLLSNLHGNDLVVNHADLFLGYLQEDVLEQLRPDLLITLGGAVLSKHVKHFLRKFATQQHWHIGGHALSPDAFQHLTRVIPIQPKHFLTYEWPISPSQSAYTELWQQVQTHTKSIIRSYFEENPSGELGAINAILNSLPASCDLHVANSLSVRYVSLVGVSKKEVRVFGNRGTSGIDGSSSTVVGHAMVSQRTQVFITGDMALFYDRNAFWHNYDFGNVRIILLNNHGGAIFGIIDGPSHLEESNEYFITHQKLNAKRLCDEYGISHYDLNTEKENLRQFFDDNQEPKLMELLSTADQSKNDFNHFKKYIRKNLWTLNFPGNN